MIRLMVEFAIVALVFAWVEPRAAEVYAQLQQAQAQFEQAIHVLEAAR